MRSNRQSICSGNASGALKRRLNSTHPQDTKGHHEHHGKQVWSRPHGQHIHDLDTLERSNPKVFSVRYCWLKLSNANRLNNIEIIKAAPKGPSRTKKATESEFSTGTKFATTIAKRYGECSEMLVFLWQEVGKRYRKWKTTVATKYYGFKRRSS